MWHSFVHLLLRSANQCVAYFSTSKFAIVVTIVAFLAPHLRVLVTQGPKATLHRVVRRLGIGGLLAILVWLCAFGWSLIRTIYTDHQDIVGTNNSLVAQNAALKKRVADLSNQLTTLQTSSPKTVTRFVPQEVGPSKPDRILTDREKDHLYEGLKKIAEDPKYRDNASVTIAPYAYQDRESERLAQQLVDVFEDAHWKVLRQNQLPIKLVGRAQNQIPIGIWILTNGDSSFRYFVWSNFNAVGLDADERPASDLPASFDGLIIWVGYKDTPF
jgi:hypothetical protein